VSFVYATGAGMRAANTKSMIREIRKAPFFPFLPFGPLLIASGLFALEVITLRHLRRIARSVDALARAARPEPA
jgi:hypothetical protein